MPKRELKHPSQVESWLQEWGSVLGEPGSLILIGSGGLLWHAAQRGLDTPLSENSMDVDPVTQSDAVALLGYEAMIGSEFEKRHGWHANLMPSAVLSEMPADWMPRASLRSTLRFCSPFGRKNRVMNSGKSPCGTRLKPVNSVFARWFLRNYRREASPASACLSSLNRWPSPMKTSRPRRRIWPAVFIGNTAAKEDRGSILSRISSSPLTHKCNAIAWQRSTAAISGATSRFCVCSRRSSSPLRAHPLGHILQP